MVQEKDELKKRVLYIGSAVPMETADGLDGVQKPLLERYPVENDNNIEGILSHLSIVKDGIMLQYVSDPNRKLFFPISSLTLCAAVRCVTITNASTGEKSARFMSLSNPAAGGANGKRPAIFTTITRRREGRKVLECHGFVCSCDKDALELVEYTSYVDRANKGKLNGAAIPPVYETNTMQSASASTSAAVATAAVAGPDGDHPIRLVTGDSASSRVAPEFYEPPPQHGYFYKTPDSQIKTYTVERVMEGESERLRAISPNAPTTLPRKPPSEKRMVYGGPPPGFMTMPPPQGPRNMIPVRVVPPHNAPVRPRFFSPPPPMMRPHPMAMPPRHMMPPDPYVFMPPVPMMEPQYVYMNSSFRRRRSHSSSSSGSSSPGSPRATNGQPVVNGNKADGSTGESSRPHTPPTDYEKGQRASRKDQFEHSQRHLREMNAGPVHYSTMPGGPGGLPPGARHPYGMYMMVPPRYLGYPPYMMQRARSVPPPMDRDRKSGKSKKDKKKKKKSGKHRMHGAPSDVSTDSVGYTSEIGPGGEYPRMPRDFRRFENQFKHERAFSKSLKEEGSRGAPQVQESGNAYSLNERMSKKGEEFNLY